MKKFTSIEMDKVRNLSYGINSLIELEKRMGKNLTSLSGDSFGLSDLRTILFVGLKHEDRELTEEKTGEIMDIAIENSGIEYLSKKLAEAMQSVFRGVKESPIPS
jgi:hypothetical protein